MTTGTILGTSYNKSKVYNAVKEVGFDIKAKSCEGINLPLHTKVKNLRLQIHPPSYFSDVEGIVTEIEFDDLTDRFPNNPEAFDILRQLYKKIPDLVYHKRGPFPDELSLVNPLSELLDPIK